MQIITMRLGAFATNCYLLTDEQKTAVIDPGDTPEQVMKQIEAKGLKVEYILLTHGHFDHTGGVARIHAETGAPIYIHKDEIFRDEPVFRGLPEGTEIHYFDEGDVLPLGSLNIEVMHTPGHSPGSCVFKVGGTLFSGDTLFRDSCGRTDFEGGSFPLMMRSLKRLHDLPGDYEVLPGHESATTLERERKMNYYMREAAER